MDDEVEQRRTNVRVMELLEQSRAAHDAGDGAMARGLMNEALGVSAMVVSALTGGMLIGNVPRPGTPEWYEYVAEQRAARAEAEDGNRPQ